MNGVVGGLTELEMNDVDSECDIPDMERTEEKAEQLATRFVSKYASLDGPPTEVVDVPKRYAKYRKYKFQSLLDLTGKLFVESSVFPTSSVFDEYDMLTCGFTTSHFDPRFEPIRPTF